MLLWLYELIFVLLNDDNKVSLSRAKSLYTVSQETCDYIFDDKLN